MSEESRLSVAKLINQSPEVEKPRPIPLSKVETELSSELTKFEQKFDFPVNPAFTFNNQNQQLSKLSCHIEKEGINPTKL